MLDRVGRRHRSIPTRDVSEVVVVADRLALVGLVLGAEVAAARLFAGESVLTHQMPELEEVVDSRCLLEGLVECSSRAR